MLKGWKGLIGPIVLIVSTVFKTVAPEVVQSVADAVVIVVDGVGTILTATGVVKKVAAEKAK